MSDTDGQVPLPDLNGPMPPAGTDVGYNEDEYAMRAAADLEAVFDVPVQVSAVLGRSKMDVSELLKLGPPGPYSSSTGASAKPSTSTSTTSWSPAAKWSWWRTSSA
ncbi:hypothetical protein ACVWW5_001783 [Bradyrhizobium sp. LM3.4]